MTAKEYTRFEKARLIGARAIQISMGAKPKVTPQEAGSFDPIDIAKVEFEQGKLPLDIVRDE
ncbi:MAG: DNA-directed RNA polymerase subunit K [archaeon]|nr:DNA-directed RNA polymerase subunit K [archaeon]